MRQRHFFKEKYSGNLSESEGCLKEGELKIIIWNDIRIKM